MKLRIVKNQYGYAMLTDESGEALPGQVETHIYSAPDVKMSGGRLVVTFDLTHDDIQFSGIVSQL